MGKHLDPRVVKTRSSLKVALISLMQQYKIENISVQKITETAHITRGTFYLHYKDKRDFISRAMTEILDDFFEVVITEVPLPSSMGTRPSEQSRTRFSLNAAFSYIESEAQMFNVLLNTQENGLFERQLFSRLTTDLERFHDAFQAEFVDLDVPISIQISFTVSAYIGLIKNWLANGMIYTPHYMTSSVHKMMTLINSEHPEKVTFTDFFYTEPQLATAPTQSEWHASV
ncbi:TetR/AcrR family transcriptional regulator [Furfurilactobacillus sp. WILCCON 0119]|uniref:TetR/AcrR family transcriptional regulator n=1 Tax=Furfurilactobacillus entadae TaxID=2922307 RepID=UPI0035E96CBC